MINDNLGHSVISKNGKVKSRPYLPPKPRPRKKTKDEETIADLGLRLQIQDELMRDDLMRLEEDITMFVRTMINSGKKAKALEFIKENKHIFGQNIKDLIANELSFMKD